MRDEVRVGVAAAPEIYWWEWCQYKLVRLAVKDRRSMGTSLSVATAITVLPARAGFAIRDNVSV